MLWNFVRGSTTTDGTVNVATVPQLSPFRYPGGKTWLIPWVRRWLRSMPTRPHSLVEPFAGGGAVSLTSVFENLTDQATMVELDENVASVWEAILSDSSNQLVDAIREFQCSPENVRSLLATTPRSLVEKAFRTIVMNRTRYGGIIAPGAASVRHGENGHGVASRWYPETLIRRIKAIADRRDNVCFLHGDGMEFLNSVRCNANAAFFIDPPYTVAGRRLYTHSEIDHERLFAVASQLSGDVLITYDDAPEIHYLANKHSFQVKRIPMRSTKHELKLELVIGKRLDWVDSGEFAGNSGFEFAQAHGTSGS